VAASWYLAPGVLNCEELIQVICDVKLCVGSGLLDVSKERNTFILRGCQK
jgi:hypothetical protein